MIRYFIGLFLLVLCMPPKVFACKQLFGAALTHQRELILRDLEAGRYQVDSLRKVPLSNRNFFLKADSGEAMIRFESDYNDLHFERFASKMFESFGILASKVKVIPIRPKLLMAMQSYLKDNPQFAKEENLKVDEGTEISVTVFLGEPFVVGADYLKGVSNRPFSNETTQRARQWENLDDHMRSSLADLWAGYVVLGISDPHPFNWLTTPDGLVIAVDFAARTTVFERGSEKTSWLVLTSPLGGEVADDFQQKLRASISPSMRERLAKLSPSTIEEIASRDSFAINEQQIAGMIARAKLLLGK